MTRIYKGTNAGPKPKPIEKRFWSKVEITDSCWIWKAGLTKSGYGFFAFGKPSRKQRASRIAWIITYGEIPKGICVCHHCDNKQCVRPSHLFLGTNKENTADSIRKNRFVKGSKNGMAKLTEDSVTEIRRLYHSRDYTLADLSKKFGTGSDNIWSIVRGKTWSHVDG